MSRHSVLQLTPLQSKLLKYIKRYREKHFISPRHVDMCKYMKRSTGSIQNLLRALKKKGFIDVEYGLYRGITILK